MCTFQMLGRGGAVAGSEDLPPPLIFMPKFKILVTLPSYKSDLR